MPKQKTHKGAAARFKVTGSGKIRHRKMGLNHFLGKKSSSRKRRLSAMEDISKADTKRVRRMLGQ
jgi:large subunit ribosomal protein L35